jgi:phosphoribosyl 1,2-cyclic phosphate phosphodiesterase
MPIYANTITQVAIKRDFYYAFEADKDAGLPEMQLLTIDPTASFKIGDIELMPIEVMHREMPVLGFRIGDFTYITDANYISEEAKAQIKGSKVLILNALRPQSHPTHFTLSEAIALTQSLDIPQTYFTHFSHQIGLHAIVEPSLPKGIGMSYDGMVITV